MTAMQGNKLPVSAFAGLEDGAFPSGTTKYENVWLHSSFQNGFQKTASSATSAPWFAHTLLSAHSSSMKKKWLASLKA